MRVRLAIFAVLALAALAAGCGQSQAAGPGTPPDAGVSHTVDPNEPPVSGGAVVVSPMPGGDPGTPVYVTALRVGVHQGRGTAVVKWYGGVTHCFSLRPVRIVRTGHTIRLVIREGSDASPTTPCEAIGVLKRTTVDLGALPAGTYTVKTHPLGATLKVT